VFHNASALADCPERMIYQRSRTAVTAPVTVARFSHERCAGPPLIAESKPSATLRNLASGAGRRAGGSVIHALAVDSDGRTAE
jgi:hypothetical protein